MISTTFRTLTTAAVSLAACVGVLAACTNSGSSDSGTAPSTTPSTSPSVSNPSASTDTSSANVSTGPSEASSPKSTGPLKTGQATGKPLATQTIQGSHLTYDISIWARDVSQSCADHVTGAELEALVRGKACTLTRFIGTTRTNGKAIGVSEATLQFGGPVSGASDSATQATVLLTSSTTVGVVDLLHDGRRLPSGPSAVPSTAPRNALNSGRTVKVVRAWYLSGTTPVNDPRLNEAVEDLSTI